MKSILVGAALILSGSAGAFAHFQGASMPPRWSASLQSSLSGIGERVQTGWTGLTAALPAWSEVAPRELRASPQYRIASLTRGEVVSSVAATGTVMPVATVLVGTQISGQIKTIHADFNAEVRRGDLIAELDPVPFEIAVEQARAWLDIARAAITIQDAMMDRAQADMENARASLAAVQSQLNRSRIMAGEAGRNAERRRQLSGSGFASVADRDRAISASEASLEQVQMDEAQVEVRLAVTAAAAAQFRSAQGQLETARANVRHREAMLRQAETQLNWTRIRAPVDGVVIQRNIEEGQTVAASLQAPVLFTIAQDLRDMQVNASVDEADIGRVQVGQPVSFMVDAFPGRQFRGDVQQIRKNPIVMQHVTTYTVIVSAPNPDQVLLPGLTANLRIIVDQQPDTLRVPTAALRFRPPGASAGSGPHIWTLGSAGPTPVAVRVGLNDGSMSAIAVEGLSAGTPVILGIEAPPPPSASRRIFGLL